MNINLMYTDLEPGMRKSWDNDVAVSRGARAVKNSILGIVTTRKGSRVFNPEFGCDLSDSLFENMNPLTSDTISRNIQNAIRNFEPRVERLAVSTICNYDNNEIIVTIRFSIIDNPAQLEEIKLQLTD